MQRPVHLALILCLVLTGIGLGAARGTVVRAEQVVLCTGHGVVIVDHPDGTRQTQVCPDMALSLLSALPGGPLDLVLSLVPAGLNPPGLVLHAHGRPSLRPAARGPPSPGISEPFPV